MSIAPIVQTVDVKAPPEKAFALFAGHFGEWWPKGGGVGKAPCVDVIVEPRNGGRWYERDAEGVETPWGTVLAWEPPTRLLLGWHLDAEWKFDADLVTEVEISFAARPEGGTRVTLEHRDLERFGPSAEAHAARLRGGWPTRVAGYADFANSQD